MHVLIDPALQLFSKSGQRVRDYDPVRAVDRDAGRRGLVDGSELLKLIREQQLDQRQTFVFEKFRRRLIEELNALLVEPSSANPIEGFEIKGEERGEHDRKERLDLYIKETSR